MGIGIWQILIVAILVVILFGRGRISDLMGDVAKGINSFKKGMKEGADDSAATDAPAKEEPKTIEGSATPVAEPEKDKDKAE